MYVDRGRKPVVADEDVADGALQGCTPRKLRSSDSCARPPAGAVQGAVVAAIAVAFVAGCGKQHADSVEAGAGGHGFGGIAASLFRSGR